MTWTALRWVWRLEAPLFIGMPPAGALNRCRPYVPARVLWGAVTAEISRSRNGENFPDYVKLGSEVALNCRFTYLFPAEKRGDKLYVWLPKYETKKGLVWYCNESELPDRDFRRRLLDSRPGTAIAPESDSASEGTLRETECINPWWRDSNCQEESSAVLLLGYVFLRNNDFWEQLNNIDTIFVGGDTRYGLGKICRIDWHGISDDLSVFGKGVHLDGENPEIQSDIVWGHALETNLGHSQSSQGSKELFGGWNRDKLWEKQLAWVPGSTFEKQEIWWSIDENGYWIWKQN
jgi:hypothetical protein